MTQYVFPFIDDGSGTGTKAAGAVVEIQGTDGSWQPYPFLLDSGAFAVTVSANVGQQLGLNPANATNADEVGGVDDQSQKAYQYNVTARFQGMTVPFKSQVPVVVMPDQGDMLLGRMNFWGAIVSSILIDCVAQMTTFTLA
jgi:hypothetical protein